MFSLACTFLQTLKLCFRYRFSSDEVLLLPLLRAVLSANEELFYHQLLSPLHIDTIKKTVFPSAKHFSCWFCINFHFFNIFFFLFFIMNNWKILNSSIYMEFLYDQKRFYKRFAVYSARSNMNGAMHKLCEL